MPAASFKVYYLGCNLITFSGSAISERLELSCMHHLITIVTASAAFLAGFSFVSIPFPLKSTTAIDNQLVA